MKFIALILLIAVLVGAVAVLQRQQPIEAPPMSPLQRALDDLEKARQSLDAFLNDPDNDFGEMAQDAVNAVDEIVNDAGARLSDLLHDGARAVDDLRQNLPCVLNCA